MKNKNSNGTGANNGKKITDFFPSSQSTYGSRANALEIDASCTRATQAREDHPALRKSGRLSGGTKKAESSATTSSKRVRSPDVTSPRSRKGGANESRQKLAKRQKKFESDSEVDMANCAPVIHVKQVGSQRNVKRLSPDEKMNVDRFESVPTSQSDEMELDITWAMERDSPEIEKPIEKKSQELGNDIALPDINSLPSSPLSPSVPLTPTSVHSGYSNGASKSHDTVIPNMSTPPISEYSPALPAFPVSVDGLGKTALLIEKIKAEARAKVQQLQDSPPPEFNEALDSSSDEDEMHFPIALDTRRKGKRSGSNPTRGSSLNVKRRKSSERDPPSDRERPALRGAKQWSASRVSLSPSARTNLPPTKAPVRGKDACRRAVKNSMKAPNPLDALLSEKRKLERAGKGAKALLQAEAALQYKESLYHDDTDRDVILARWSDESAARNVVQEVLAKDRAELEEINSLEVSLDAEEAAKLIGANAGKVTDILKRDQENEEQDVYVGGAREVRLWAKTSQPGPIEHAPQGNQSHPLHYSGANQVIRLLKTAIDQQDHTQARLIMESGVLCSVDLGDCGNLMSLLFEQAFSYPPCSLKSSAFLALTSIYSKPARNVPPLSITWLHHTFASLGAEQTMLEQMGYHPCSTNEDTPNADYRTSSILHMVHVMEFAAQSRLVETSHISDLILTLLLVALDPSTNHELRHDVTKLVDVFCNMTTADMEARVCARAISFCMTLDLPYRAQFASVLSNGSGAARRIARWVAHAALVDRAMSSQDITMGMPPLQELLDVLDFGHVFRVNDDSDYVALWHRIRIMSIGLTDIELYNNTAEPDHSLEQGQLGSPTKRRNKHTLILIHEALERLHAEIQDTRALHLDRSRVKAAIKQLSLRLRYQHTDSAHDRVYRVGLPRRRTLDHFFSPKKREL